MNQSQIRWCHVGLRFLLFATLLLHSALGSCFAGQIIENKTFSGPKVTIKYAQWGGADDVQETIKICKTFILKYPNIRVEVDVYPWGQYWTKVQTEMASGIAPDVMSFYSGSFGVWAQRGALLPLNTYLKSAHFDLKSLYPAAVKNCEWNQQLYAMPNNIAIWSLVYSKDRLEESGIPESQWPSPDHPMKWAQFLNLSRRLTLRNPDGTFRQYGMSAGQNWEQAMASMEGGMFVNHQVQPTRPTLTGNTQLLQGLTNLFQAEYADRSILGATPISSDSSVNNTDTILTSPRYAMGTTGPWALPQLKQAGVRFGVSPLPEASFPINLINVNSVGIYAYSKHPQEAYDFIQFLTSLKMQQLIGSKLKGVPVLKAAVGAFIHNSYHIPDCQAFVYDVQIAKPSITTNITEVNTDFTNFFNDLGQKLDTLYDAQLSRVKRTNGTISSADYKVFENKMKASVAALCASSLHSLDRQMKISFSQAHLPPPTFSQKYVWPVIILAGMAAFLTAYLSFAKRQRSSPSGTGISASSKTGLAFLSPWLFGLVFFTLGPLLAALLLSFTHWDMIRPPEWIGIQHYALLPSYQFFWMGLWKTLLYAVLVIPISLIGGLATAGLLTCKIKGGPFFRAIIYLPSLFTGAEAAVLWTHMLNKDHGILNEILSWLHIAPVSWLDATHAFYSVVMMNLFWIGSSMIIYYAGMKQIPASLYEAADLDGAGALRKFFRVTVPLLSPVILFLVIMTTIGAFQVFTPALFFASSSYSIGDPDNSLRFYAVNIYDAAFNKLEMGTACTYAVILFLLIFLITMVQMRLSKRFVYTDGA